MFNRFGVFAREGDDVYQLKMVALKYLDNIKKEQILESNSFTDKTLKRIQEDDFFKDNTLKLIEKIQQVIQGKAKFENVEEPFNVIRSAAILDDPTNEFPLITILLKMGIDYTQEDIDWIKGSRLGFTAHLLQQHFDETMSAQKLGG